jgi:hypothetical protein
MPTSLIEALAEERAQNERRYQAAMKSNTSEQAYKTVALVSEEEAARANINGARLQYRFACSD